MFEFKLQVGCLLISMFFIVTYIKEILDKKVKCNRIFDGLLVVAPWAIIFDGATAWTVNHMEVVPGWLNLMLHGLFFVLMNVVTIHLFIYMVHQTVGLKSRNKLVIALIPGVISTLGILISLPELYYVEGKLTNYSMGLPVYFCYASVALHFLFTLMLVTMKHRTIEKIKKFNLICFVSIMGLVLAIQLIFPELLISSVLPALAIVGLYVSFENPSYRKLQHYNKEMVTAFATLVENRDNSTGGHIKRTSGYVDIILNEMKKSHKYRTMLSRDYIKNVTQAAPMHDIGKISTPDHILQKPGKLTDEEYAIMKQHAPVGGEIIRETFADIEEPEYQKIAYEMARYHHEKWNGLGYPEGLRGEEIPLHARIMAIADVFDAVSAKRCYRDAMPIEECFRIIEEGAGTDFDPRLVAIFLDARQDVMDLYSQHNSN